MAAVSPVIWRHVVLDKQKLLLICFFQFIESFITSRCFYFEVYSYLLTYYTYILMCLSGAEVEFNFSNMFDKNQDSKILFWDIVTDLPWTPNGIGFLEPKGVLYRSYQVAPVTWTPAGANSQISWGGKRILWRRGIFFCAVMPRNSRISTPIEVNSCTKMY